MWIQQERSPKCNYFPGITEDLIFFFFYFKVEGQDYKKTLIKSSPFWNILQWFFFLVTGESDDSASAPSPEVQSSCVKQDGQKLLQGHLYYAVFPVVNHCAVSIFSLFNLFLFSQIQFWYRYYTVLKRRAPFLSQNSLYVLLLPLKSCKVNRLLQGCQSIILIWKCQKKKGAKKSTAASRPQQAHVSYKHGPFF